MSGPPVEIIDAEASSAALAAGLLARFFREEGFADAAGC